MRTGLLSLALFLILGGTPMAEPENAGNGGVPVQIKRVLLVEDAPAVLLVNKNEDRFLLVFIDFFMANAIRLGMERPTLERPLTHDLIGIFLNRLGAKIKRIDITELKNSTYYALIHLEVNGKTEQIDARPSDALALAVRNRIPVFANPDLLREVNGRKENREESVPPVKDRSRSRSST